jgi:BASS family bile acid:Na+ symporter
LEVFVNVTSEQWISVLNVTALSAIMLSMGLRVDVKSVWTAARPARIVAFCILANYLLVPVAALVLLYLFQADPLVSIGFLILAVCPGAPVGPPMSALAKGNLPLAISMMVLLAALSAILSPILLAFLAPRLAPDGNLDIDLLAIARSLIFAQLAPLAAGLAIHHWLPRWTERLNRPMTLLANVLLVILLAAIVGSQFSTLIEIKFKAWFGMTLLFVASFLIGWFSGGPHIADRKSIGITTVNRNVAVGLAIVASSFPNTPAVIAVVAYGLFTIVGSLACAMLLSRTPRRAA